MGLDEVSVILDDAQIDTGPVEHANHEHRKEGQAPEQCHQHGSARRSALNGCPPFGGAGGACSGEAPAALVDEPLALLLREAAARFSRATV